MFPCTAEYAESEYDIQNNNLLNKIHQKKTECIRTKPLVSKQIEQFPNRKIKHFQCVIYFLYIFHNSYFMFLYIVCTSIFSYIYILYVHVPWYCRTVVLSFCRTVVLSHPKHRTTKRFESGFVFIGS